MKDIFDQAVCNEVINRIQQLKPDTQPQWGKMNVAQMLAHCNVTYEMVFENKHPEPNFMVQLLLKMFVKKSVVSPTPYKQNSKTAPAFIITDLKNFELERQRLVQYLKKVAQLGRGYFENKKSLSFGKLTANEWNNMFYKHLDHHLNQFGQ